MNKKTEKNSINSYVKTYCIVASVMLLFPPVYRQGLYGSILREKFPNNFVPIKIAINSHLLHIDWSLLVIELLLLLFVIVYLYCDNSK